MPTRTAFVAGNWKMNLDRRSARALVTGLLERFEGTFPCDVGVFPPFTLLAEVASQAAGTALIVGAQDCHPEAHGAFTGEVSATMIRDAGASHVILGHSERRRDFHEDEALLGRKLRAAFDAGLAPILCVGETLEQRDAGQSLAVVRGQVEGALAEFDEGALATLTIAYEPVWAIGTGQNATPAQAVEVHAEIRRVVAAAFSPGCALRLRIQYGGSVKSANAAALLGEEEIDGALVGGAALDLTSFAAIVEATSS